MRAVSFRKVEGFTISTNIYSKQLAQSNSPFPYVNQQSPSETLIHESHVVLHSSDSSLNNRDDEVDEANAKNAIEDELETLQQTLSSIEALEERNKAQIESFVDEDDQWDSLEDFERELLSSKTEVAERMEKIAEELLQMWMGANS